MKVSPGMSVKLTLQLDTSMCLGPHSERALDESVLVECDGTALAIPVTAKVLAPQVRSTVAVGVCACVSVPVCLCLCVCACVSVSVFGRKHSAPITKNKTPVSSPSSSRLFCTSALFVPVLVCIPPLLPPSSYPLLHTPPPFFLPLLPSSCCFCCAKRRMLSTRCRSLLSALLAGSRPSISTTACICLRWATQPATTPSHTL